MSANRPCRTWPQRLTFLLVLVTALSCFATAGALATGQWVLSQRQLVELTEPESDPGERSETDIVVPGASTTLPSDSPTTTTTIALAEPDAANFLVVGADNNDCVGSETPTVGDRSDLGERSDTIMIWRANPESNQLAVLSLPRDLFVDIAGGRKARINSAFRRDDPSRLIDTIFLNFGIPIDHYVQIDFCAFKQLVDAVGGVSVPFDAPAYDRGSGFEVTTTGCVRLDGEMALAYVRSRKYRFEDPVGSGNYEQDGTSDFGRIARQQDFLRRVITKVIDEGLYSPGVATALIETNREYVVTDAGLTLRRMLEFGNTLQNLDPDTVTTYRIETSSVTTSAGDQVERPRIDGDNMQAILAVFRGEARLSTAPEQDVDATEPDASSDAPSEAPSDVATTAPTTEFTLPAQTVNTLPSVEADENLVGVAPDRDLRCD